MAHRARVLLVGFDRVSARPLAHLLTERGFFAGECAWPLPADSPVPDLIVLSAPEIVEQLRDTLPGVPVLMVGPEVPESRLRAAVGSGAAGWMSRSLPPEAIARGVERMVNDSEGDSVVAAAPEMVGESEAVRDIRRLIARVAGTESNVLITGETGTGKELTAGLIHSQSRRRSKPFVCVNCAAIPDTLIESELFGYERGAFTGAHAANQGKLRAANGGTVFFDEIGDMAPHTQAKILRVVESRQAQPLGGTRSFQFDGRVIAATNQDLETAMIENRFRRDLYYRLNVARIQLPPLRERKEDIAALAHHYLAQFNDQFGREVAGMSRDVLEALLRHDWPGNIRELKNVLEAAYVNGADLELTISDLPEEFRKRMDSFAALPERDRLLAALAATEWNKSEAAKTLHCSRMTLYRKLAKHSIQVRHRAAGTA